MRIEKKAQHQKVPLSNKNFHFFFFCHTHPRIIFLERVIWREEGREERREKKNTNMRETN